MKGLTKLSVARKATSMTYTAQIEAAKATIEKNGPSWSGISAESVARMRAQNKFQTGLDIARYTAKIMREEGANVAVDTTNRKLDKMMKSADRNAVRFVMFVGEAF